MKNQQMEILRKLRMTGRRLDDAQPRDVSHPTHHAQAFPPFPAPAISSLLRGLMNPEFDVRYTAQLARLHLSEDEIVKFQAQLSQVLEYVEALRQVDVSGVEPTAHANAVFNVFRVDESRPGFTQEQALANAPRQANQLFIVPKVIE